MMEDLVKHKYRAFIAVLLPEHIKSKIFELTLPLRKFPWDIKWVEKENYHLTLKFLGSISDKDQKKINELLNEIISEKFTLTLGGWGVFPSFKKPRVLWIGIGGSLKKLGAVKDNLEDKLSQAGFSKEEKEFHPHITLGRFRFPQSDISVFIPKLQEILQFKFPVDFLVDGFHLMESKLTPKGPYYSSLFKYKFL